MLEYKYDTQLLIEGSNFNKNIIRDYFIQNFEGDCLLVVGHETLIRIHYYTNEPWRVLEYCASLGEVCNVIVENMEWKVIGLHG
ncbi:MAG: kinase to dihydroxyacetone kinase [Hungatella sp.]|jgi:dihydroxyacetone kinase-like predicted kinase|nr:kinase to dihydroxyacetone kinase [Hungatella sp.]